MDKTVEQPDPPAKRKRKSYTTVVVEASMPRPRTNVWAAVLAMIEASTTAEFGNEMSNEPPWRYVYDRTDAPAVLCECSITIRDDGPTCNMAWAALIDPLPRGASDPFVDSVRSTFQGYIDAIAERISTEPS